MGSLRKGELVRRALRDAGVRAGIIDTALVRFADTSGIRVDDANHVIGADEAVAELQRRAPGLFLAALRACASSD